ncbi:hypothetical protein MMC10_011328 [Thelotrema lepadinum]|nr:hypothetical protein [Thelotrema lepadinum]
MENDTLLIFYRASNGDKQGKEMYDEQASFANDRAMQEHNIVHRRALMRKNQSLLTPRPSPRPPLDFSSPTMNKTKRMRRGINSQHHTRSRLGDFKLFELTADGKTSQTVKTTSQRDAGIHANGQRGVLGKGQAQDRIRKRYTRRSRPYL